MTPTQVSFSETPNLFYNYLWGSPLKNYYGPGHSPSAVAYHTLRIFFIQVWDQSQRLDFLLKDWIYCYQVFYCKWMHSRYVFNCEKTHKVIKIDGSLANQVLWQLWLIQSFQSIWGSSNTGLAMEENVQNKLLNKPEEHGYGKCMIL